MRQLLDQWRILVSLEEENRDLKFETRRLACELSDFHISSRSFLLLPIRLFSILNGSYAYIWMILGTVQSTAPKQRQ